MKIVRECSAPAGIASCSIALRLVLLRVERGWCATAQVLDINTQPGSGLQLGGQHFESQWRALSA